MPRKANYDRDTLIDKALELFWKCGWAGTSMKDLEAALDLRPGSFYAAFGSKEALYGLALDRYAALGTVRLRNLARENDPLSALKAHLFAVVSAGESATGDEDSTEPCAKPAARACMLAKTLLELGPQGSALADQASAHLKRMEGEFAALFRAAQVANHVSPERDPDQLARRFQSDLLGLRVSAERADVDARVLAKQIGDDLDRLAAPCRAADRDRLSQPLSTPTTSEDTTGTTFIDQ
ncbi:MAG: helix-turn-helix domain-containing protein [Pseudomonadota bacterium]